MCNRLALFLLLALVGTRADGLGAQRQYVLTNGTRAVERIDFFYCTGLVPDRGLTWISLRPGESHSQSFAAGYPPSWCVRAVPSTGTRFRGHPGPLSMGTGPLDAPAGTYVLELVSRPDVPDLDDQGNGVLRFRASFKLGDTWYPQ